MIMQKPTPQKQALNRYRLPITVLAKDITALERGLNAKGLLSITPVDAKTAVIRTTDAGMAELEK